ncbi:tRNA pseudouridine(65) synthase TruC [Geobacter sp. OR-1]|uniref:tRNA pseudouridine(65) synthase TruC n=1 Tax=Geobacter sp. OR-1 TaxID=1266765 RepID=UPI001872487F
MESSQALSPPVAVPDQNDKALPILFQDDYLVAVNKPSGLLVHRSPIDRHETRFALQTVRNQTGRRVYPIHRLDKPTSGVLLFAFSPEIARTLVESFTAGAVQKSYLAVVRGYAPDDGTIDYPLVEDQDKHDHIYTGIEKEGQAAVTDFRTLARIELQSAVGRYDTSRYSLVALSPRTGRRHQLRRHFKHIFHPIIGDTRYGEGRHNRFFREEFGMHRLLLHAAELTFPHPVTGVPVELTAPLDRELMALLARLGWLNAVPPGWR